MCFFAVTGGTITVIVFYHGNGLHGNYRSFTVGDISIMFPCSFAVGITQQYGIYVLLG